MKDVSESRMVVEFLPDYAPELNPVEYLWHQLKGEELRDKPCMDLKELHESNTSPLPGFANFRT